jgi:hypothetical protein
MKETTETPDGGHYNRCGEYEKLEDESNAALLVRRCSGCGETRVESNVLTNVLGTILTLVSIGHVGTLDFTTPPSAVGSVIEPLYPAMGLILAGVILATSIYMYRHLNRGITLPGGDDQ